MNKQMRIGVYGVCQEKSCLLLVPKKSGPYKGQLDLPGGAMEFGESPEAALQREFSEEVASGFSTSRLLFNLSHVTNKIFYHIGLIYSVTDRFALDDRTAEDDFYWIEFSKLATTALTPFADQAVKILRL